MAQRAEPSPVVDAPDKNFLVNGKQLAACLSATFNCSRCRKVGSLVPDESPASSRSWGSWGLTVCLRCRYPKCRATYSLSLCADRVVPASSLLLQEGDGVGQTDVGEGCDRGDDEGGWRRKKRGCANA